MLPTNNMNACGNKNLMFRIVSHLDIQQTQRKAEGTHRSCVTYDVHCQRKKISSPTDWEGASKTTKFATTMQEKSILADYRARKAG
ncbi:hypothetical protein GHT06_022734 [Daphnia sinensis]|uniref:Uncharacterized protein n=1 Tax=Daphnia sinensis TaxID=1820382 RepID=A0AAD5KYJ9_9CRUS|nr:hypothetical protein GHT06_022734 [Daphnia sinensis]